MKINRILLLGIILFIYSCGGDSPYLLTARSPGQLGVSVDKPFVIGLLNLPPDGDATDDIVVTVSGGSGSYSLSAGGWTPLFTPPPAPTWIPAPSITLDPDIVTAITRVKFTATDTVNGSVGEAALIIIPLAALTGNLQVLLADDTTLNCGDTITVVVLGGVPPYTITEGTAFISITGSPVGASGGSFDVVGDACTGAGTNDTIVTVTDSETVPNTLAITFTTLDP